MPTRRRLETRGNPTLISTAVPWHGGGTGMTHVEAGIFYDGWAIVGSTNFDKLSLRINQETDLATSDSRFVDRLKQDLFERDFAKSRELRQPPTVGGANISPNSSRTSCDAARGKARL